MMAATTTIGDSPQAMTRWVTPTARLRK
jgi:hypothetical protein